MEFKVWLEQKTPATNPVAQPNEQPVVSFDFDGVLHTDIIPGTHHPLDHYDYDLTPNLPMHRKLRQEAAKNKVIVVSARCPESQELIADFCQQYKLPVFKIFTTCDQPKLPILQAWKVIRHYDDHEKVGQQLAGTGIEFVPVKVPLNKKMARIQKNPYGGW